MLFSLLASALSLLALHSTVHSVDAMPSGWASLGRHQPFVPPTELAPPTLTPTPSSAAPPAAAWTIDASKPLINVSVDLYGIFFEEINHGGTGGMWAQQIQNYNFEDTRGIVAPWKSLDTGAKYQLVLDDMMPINAMNAVSLQVLSDNGAATAGVMNPGWFGINSTNGLVFDGSMYVRSATITSVEVALVDASLPSKVLASASVPVSMEWRKQNFSLTSSADGTAMFQITWKTVSAADRINFDVVALFPRKGWMDLPYLRPDLAQYVADMHPAFVRFPGGCFVEGQIIANRFNWKRSIGPLEARPGHWNLWGYWNEDGLAYFEFLQLIERMTDSYGQPTRAIWVVNNGISHEESIGPQDIQPYIQDALDSLEFAMGPADSYWGSRRAAMGHTSPFASIYAVAIGNEDCGKPSYADNYQLFYDQLSAAYPSILLISNCDPLDDSFKGHPAELWDYHIYTSAENMFRMSDNFFDKAPWRTQTSAKIFNSEYAVTDGAGLGNMRAAVGEAAWMNGLERNSDLVTTASYAPLFVQQEAPGYKWQPDAINFNSQQAFGTPSYWNQVMYGESFQGCVSGSVRTLSYTLDGATNVSVAVAICSLTPQMAAAKAAHLNRLAALFVLCLCAVRRNVDGGARDQGAAGADGDAEEEKVDAVVQDLEAMDGAIEELVQKLKLAIGGHWFASLFGLSLSDDVVSRWILCGVHICVGLACMWLYLHIKKQKVKRDKKVDDGRVRGRSE